MLSEEILEKIKEIDRLLCQINKYWTKLDFWKSDRKYDKNHVLETNIEIYTIEEDDKKEERVNYILRETIDLNENTAGEQLDTIIGKIKELITTTNEND